jgi:exopolyphosphatase
MSVSGINGLNQMVTEARSALGSDATHHAVIGNESADLDSMASTLMYAFYLRCLQRDSAKVLIPLMNIPREDFALRRDVSYMFGQVGIDPGLLIFRDEIDLSDLHRRGRLQITLVDHNRLGRSQSALAGAVMEIVDHHQDTADILGIGQRLIEPVGSTATLVAEKILSEFSDLLDRPLAFLLLGTILADTVNLDAHAKRATNRDRETAEALKNWCSENTEQLYNLLIDLKTDLSGLNTNQILRKDFKAQYLGAVQCGISSVPLSIEGLAASDNGWPARIAEFAHRRCLDLYLVMLYQQKPRFKRQLIAFSEDEHLLDRSITYLETHGIPLALLTRAGPDGKKNRLIRCYEQINPENSRKIVQNRIQQYFQKNSKDQDS